MSRSRYWHFARYDRAVKRVVLRYNDRREVRVGETLRVPGPPVLCEHGLHASPDILSAVAYAGDLENCLCLVELEGDVIHSKDKSVATGRRVIAMLDFAKTSKVLDEWCRWCTLQVLPLWPDAPARVKEFLLTGDYTLSQHFKPLASEVSASWNSREGRRSAAVAVHQSALNPHAISAGGSYVYVKTRRVHRSALDAWEDHYGFSEGMEFGDKIEAELQRRVLEAMEVHDEQTESRQ